MPADWQMHDPVLDLSLRDVTEPPDGDGQVDVGSTLVMLWHGAGSTLLPCPLSEISGWWKWHSHDMIRLHDDKEDCSDDSDKMLARATTHNY